eukprot:CAMPEP_0197905602 /NCGR_PEP_ID=MMETSP1439-20131203/60758_1 /TAXON_ID=66791 /ORGANISM="Gonyaulax spinifera, Strain CCMP409" /LENGTH=72 /DNA_ID=CAMNT_0043526887 /DNA_START=76 /DNA_END=294 /DNA_ORIENTATION=+
MDCCDERDKGIENVACLPQHRPQSPPLPPPAHGPGVPMPSQPTACAWPPPTGESLCDFAEGAERSGFPGGRR